MKKLICMLLIIVLTGCSATVDINISENKDVSDSIKVRQLKSQTVITDYNGYADSILKDYFPKEALKEYKKQYYDDNNYFGVDLQDSKYYNVCYGISTSSLRYLSTDLKCTLNYGTYKITMTPTYLFCGDDCMEKPEISSVNLNITLPYEAIKHNANSVDGNKYTWNFVGNKDEKLELEFKLQRKKTISKEEKASEINKVIIAIVVIILTVVITLSGLVLYFNFKSKNIKY